MVRMPGSVSPTQRIPLGRWFFIAMAGIATVITTISGVLSLFEPDVYILNIIRYFFDVDRECNIPAWFSAGLWLVLGLTVFLVMLHTRRYRIGWSIFALVAFVASIDEYARLHERLERFGKKMAAFLQVDGFLHWGWVIPGMIIVIAVAAVLIPLVIRLPHSVRNGILLAGFLFVLGAVGFETIGGLSRKHDMPILYIVTQHIEEWLEMVGVTLAVSSVLGMIEFSHAEEGFVTRFRGYREKSGGRRFAQVES